MKFLADENVDRQIVDRLRLDGYSLFYVIEIKRSISDDEVLELANSEGAILLTADKDFGELVFRQRRIVNGIILFRLSGLSPEYKAELISKAIHEHEDELRQNFVVISHGSVRIRKLIDY